MSLEPSNIPEFPNYPTSSYETIYCTTDKEAQKYGCYYGLVVAHLGRNFWVLTSIGIRYYGCECEHEFIRSNDPRWIVIRDTWKQGLNKIADLQSKIEF